MKTIHKGKLENLLRDFIVSAQLGSSASLPALRKEHLVYLSGSTILHLHKSNLNLQMSSLTLRARNNPFRNYITNTVSKYKVHSHTLPIRPVILWMEMSLNPWQICSNERSEPLKCYYDYTYIRHESIHSRMMIIRIFFPYSRDLLVNSFHYILTTYEWTSFSTYLRNESRKKILNLRNFIGKQVNALLNAQNDCSAQ